jgi:hypothetical protein
VSEPTSFPKKRKYTKAEDTESRESCLQIMDFFKLLEEMESKKISEKSGRRICKGPFSSKIEYAYDIKINPEIKVEKPGKSVSKKRRNSETDDIGDGST